MSLPSFLLLHLQYISLTSNFSPFFHFQWKMYSFSHSRLFPYPRSWPHLQSSPLLRPNSYSLFCVFIPFLSTNFPSLSVCLFVYLTFIYLLIYLFVYTCMCMYTAHANICIGEKTRMRERDLKLFNKTETGALKYLRTLQTERLNSGR